MKASMEWSWASGSGLLEADVPETEEGLWRWVGENLAGLPIPCVLGVVCEKGSAVLEVQERGTWMDDGGGEHPCMFVVPVENGIDLPAGAYGDAYLTCIHANSRGGQGNYKFYWLSQLDDGRITAKYGRIGVRGGFGSSREIRDPNPSWMFWPRYFEKVQKGYIDQTSVYLAGPAGVRGEGGHAGEQAEDTADSRLFAKLMAFAKDHVDRALIQGTDFTAAQLAACRGAYADLQLQQTVAGFNDALLALMQICPRTVRSVRSQLADAASEFAGILDRESDLLDAMEAIVSGRRPGGPGTFSELGTDVRPATEDEIGLVKSHLCDSLGKKVAQVWAVDNKSSTERFGRWCEKRGISDTRLLWHGSRRASWASIVSNGLSLEYASPYGMFGRALYFSDDSVDGKGMKSWGYTDRGWRRSSSGDAACYMALFECAYGEPLEAECSSRDYSQEMLDSKGRDCVHAYRGCSGLRNEEIMFYDDDSVRIRFLVEFSA